MVCSTHDERPPSVTLRLPLLLRHHSVAFAPEQLTNGPSVTLGPCFNFGPCGVENAPALCWGCRSPFVATHRFHPRNGKQPASMLCCGYGLISPISLHDKRRPSITLGLLLVICGSRSHPSGASTTHNQPQHKALHVIRTPHNKPESIPAWRMRSPTRRMVGHWTAGASPWPKISQR